MWVGCADGECGVPGEGVGQFSKVEATHEVGVL